MDCKYTTVLLLVGESLPKYPFSLGITAVTSTLMSKREIMELKNSAILTI